MLLCLRDQDGPVPRLIDFGGGMAGQANPHCWPSRAFLDVASGKLHVGPAALQRYYADPDSGTMFPSAKRYFRYVRWDQLDASVLPPRLRERPWPVPKQTGGRWWSPQDVLDELITHVVKSGAAASRHGRGWDSLTGCVGCPAEWQEEPRLRLAQLVGAMGIDTHGLADVVDEPILAARAYLTMTPNAAPGDYVVYDFGGGSFDAAWVRYEGPGQPLCVTACLGDLELGGDDTDVAIARMIEERVAGLTREDVSDLREYVRGPEGDAYLVALWDLMAEQAKRRIRHDPEVRISAIELRLDRLPTRGTVHDDAQIVITRNEMAEALRPFVRARVDCLDRLTRQRFAHHGEPDIHTSLKTKAGAVAGVILVGGMTKMPLIQDLIREELPEVALLSVSALDPEEMVGLGTCLVTEFDNINTHRLCYQVRVDFLGRNGRCCGQVVAMARYERGYDWHETLHGDIPLRQSDDIPLPPGAHCAQLVYVDQAGNETAEDSYTHVSCAAMQRVTHIELSGSPVRVHLRPTGLLSVFIGTTAEVLPHGMPWLGQHGQRLLREAIEQRGERWRGDMEVRRRIDEAYE